MKDYTPETKLTDAIRLDVEDNIVNNSDETNSVLQFITIHDGPVNGSTSIRNAQET